jgi:uncharacterized SAM-binding protein YcdF (DUF218 family)
MIRKIWRFGLVTAVLLGLGVLIVALDVYRFSLRDETRPADAAIVLGAAVYGERPSPVFRERINHAIGLYEAGLVTHIIFTGGVGYRDALAEAEVARNYALARGVPAEAILLETTSTSTWENLTNARLVAQQQGIETVLVVSTPFHMRRALALAEDVGLEAYSSPTRTTRWISRLTQTWSFAREVVAYGVYLFDFRDA